MTEVIRVVSGAAIDSTASRVLLGLRKPGAPRAGLWEMPGGKIEPDETPRQALEREWREELGVTVKAGESIDIATIELEHVYVIYLYEVRSSEMRAARAIDHVELAWVDPCHAISHLPCSPGLYLNFAALHRWMTGKIRVEPTAVPSGGVRMNR